MRRPADGVASVPPERSTTVTDEDLIRSLLESATADLRAPDLNLRPGPPVVPLQSGQRPARDSWPKRLPLAVTAAAIGAAAAVLVMFGLGEPATTVVTPHPGPAPQTTTLDQPGTSALYQLASTVRALPLPTGRYAVQLEKQRQGSVSYLKATVIDSLTGNTWTYQRGAGVPSVLPMAPGFSPTESELQASDPTDPARLRAALISQATASDPHPESPQAPDALAVTQAIQTLWNPLVEPALRAALVAVIASSPGVVTDTHATDSMGRPAIEISYNDTGSGYSLSVYLDPSTGTVLENSQRPSAASANPADGGSDVYLSQYWTDVPPTTNPLNG